MGSVPACWDQFGKIVYKTLYMARVKTSWKLSILYGKYEKKAFKMYEGNLQRLQSQFVVTIS